MLKIYFMDSEEKFQKYSEKLYQELQQDIDQEIIVKMMEAYQQLHFEFDYSCDSSDTTWSLLIMLNYLFNDQNR